ncbi:unnamed protein product, partial [Closterium sp. NIES-53]
DSRGAGTVDQGSSTAAADQSGLRTGRRPRGAADSAGRRRGPSTRVFLDGSCGRQGRRRPEHWVVDQVDQVTCSASYAEARERRRGRDGEGDFGL